MIRGTRAKSLYGFLFVVCLVVGILHSSHVSADNLTSSSYQVIDSSLQSASFATSSNFQLWSSLSDIATKVSTAASYVLGGGFLQYPFASSPVVGITPGDASVSLSWTASEGILGWSPTSYSVGQSTASSGPYIYSTVGNTLSSTRGGLANGVTYYFVVRVHDAYGNVIATSAQVSATPVAAPVIPNNNNGGGGGGGGGNNSSVGLAPTNATGVTFTGRAYPKSSITLLKDAQVAATTVAGADATFSISLSGLSAGSYIFSVYGEDSTGLRSSLLSFPVSVTSGATTNVGGIFITPTIAVDKSEVKQGDNIAIFGQSSPTSEITISIGSAEEHFEKRTTDKSGVYLLNFDTSVLELGQHHTKAKTAVNGEISSFSSVVAFIVGTKNVLAQRAEKVLKGDLNNDGKVNLIDFSIASFWYKRSLSDSFKKIEVARLNGDGSVNLIDFSIMAFYWTG